jgi:hypothetical protein
MEIKVLGIGTDCVSLFTKEHEEFIGYVEFLNKTN